MVSKEFMYKNLYNYYFNENKFSSSDTESFLFLIDKDINLVRGSIRKWSLIVHLQGEDQGLLNCPLCLNYGGENMCGGCPVGIAVNSSGCDETPYEDWHFHHRHFHFSDIKHDESLKMDITRIVCSDCREIAQEELMFLQSVLEILKSLRDLKSLKS